MCAYDSIDMLDLSWTETSGRLVDFLSMETNKNVHDKGSAMSRPRPPGNGQALYMKNNTVKELIRMRNLIQSGQNRISLQNKTPEHGLQYTMPGVVGETTAEGPGPQSSAAVRVNTQQATQQHQAPKRHPLDSIDGKMSFLQWQICQEARHLQGLDSEILRAQDEDGDTLLHIAVAHGRRALAYVLAWNMARVGSLDFKEHNGLTALQIAVVTNHHLIVQDLLLNGAQINTVDCWGRSPLHICTERAYSLILQSVKSALWGSGTPIDVDVFSYDGLTPLHSAVLSHNTTVRELRGLSAPCLARAELEERRARLGECVKTLLLMGACCGTKDLKSGRTSLHMASEEANLELLHVILNQPSAMSVINAVTFNGNTALHFVCGLPSHVAQVSSVRLLMRRGADPAAKNIESELPVHLVPRGPVGDEVRQVLKGKYVHD